MWLIFVSSLILAYICIPICVDKRHPQQQQQPPSTKSIFIIQFCSLRTSETNYLNEAYQFYAAIRGRAYYSRAIKEDRPDLMVKKLRYYARFIVVCLLLKKMKLVRELIIELDKQIQEYTTTWVLFLQYRSKLLSLIHHPLPPSRYEPEDQLEWSLVLEEIKGFIKAEAAVAVLHPDSNPIVLSYR